MELTPETATMPGMYRIQFIKPGGRIRLESQMLLFARYGGNLYFSARPTFGTQDFPADKILSITRMPDDAEVYVNWDPRKTDQKPISWKHKR
jgi:hypothetical protein